MSAQSQTLASQLSQEFCRLHPIEAGIEFEKLPVEQTTSVLGAIPPSISARVLALLNPDTAARVMAGLEPDRAVELLERLDLAAATHLTSRLPLETQEPLLARLRPDLASELRELISYPPQTAASMMDPEVLALKPSTLVADALERLRRLRDRKIHRVYLIDPERRLLGSLSIRELALADLDATLDSLNVTEPASVQAMATHEEVVEMLTSTREASLPVVDIEGRLLGVLLQSALLEATRQDATADMQSMVGAGKSERALSKVSLAVRKRLPWLQVNLVTAFLAASVVGLFEGTISRYTALAVLLPVVAGQSGNTGAQALAVTMRGLALREIRTRQWLRVCFKETKVGAINGVAVAITTALGVFVWSRSAGLALVIGVSMVLAMIAAGFSGAAVPMVLTALKQDPAQSSSIILTTITDVVGFFSFLGIATLLLGIL